MGHRKSKARVIKKERPKVPTTFDCIFCNHAKTVEAKLDRQGLIGSIRCRVCDAKFQTVINNLSDPVDIYTEWLDKTEEANRLHNEFSADDDVARVVDDDHKD